MRFREGEPARDGRTVDDRHVQSSLRIERAGAEKDAGEARREGRRHDRRADRPPLAGADRRDVGLHEQRLAEMKSRCGQSKIRVDPAGKLQGEVRHPGLGPEAQGAAFDPERSQLVPPIATEQVDDRRRDRRIAGPGRARIGVRQQVDLRVEQGQFDQPRFAHQPREGVQARLDEPGLHPLRRRVGSRQHQPGDMDRRPGQRRELRRSEPLQAIAGGARERLLQPRLAPAGGDGPAQRPEGRRQRCQHGQRDHGAAGATLQEIVPHGGGR